MAFVYTNAELLMKQQSLNLVTATLKVVLVDATYTADPDHVNVSSISASEVTGTGYTPGFNSASRKTLSGKSFAADNANNRVTFAASDLVYTAISVGSVAAAVIIKENTTDADSLLIMYLDAPTPYVTNAGDMTLSFSGGFPFVTTL